MSSDEGQGSKRKKAHRPCDGCRKRKRRCDGEEPCSRCMKYDFTCTYEQKAIKRTSSSYVQSLESRLKTVESLLQHQSGPPVFTPPPKPSDLHNGPGVQIVTAAIRSINNPFPVPHSDDLGFMDVSDKLGTLKISQGFHGKSSQAMLVKSVMDLKGLGAKVRGVQKRPMPDKPWAMRPWAPTRSSTKYIFPEDNLIVQLVTFYFLNVNAFYSLLHRQTFESAIADGVHLTSETEFGATVLLVCALGAQYSTDPRVRSTIPGSPPGHIWFDQVDLVVCSQPTLYTLQSYCLAILYLERTSGPRACWTLVGIGIRLGQDMGAHRERTHRGPVIPEAELEKRAYWLLTLLDTQFSAALGRSIAIHIHDFDLGFPIRCDDEYWVDGTFVQPPEKPSSVDFFVLQLKLQKIWAYTLKIFYTTNRNQRLLIGLNDDNWVEPLVVEFDSALNSWLESIPEHLRWNPDGFDAAANPNPLFFDQSAALYCMFYFAQILVHRPFIPAAHQTQGPGAKPRTFPSLSICNNAARACAGLVDMYDQHRPDHPLICGPTPAFTAGIVLLLNVWGMARNNKNATGSVTGRERSSEQDVLDMKDVRRCLKSLQVHKAHWPSAAPLADTLEQLLKIDIEQAIHAQFPYPPAQGPPRTTRSYSPSPFSGPPLDDNLIDAAVAQWSRAEDGNSGIDLGLSIGTAPSSFDFVQQEQASAEVDSHFDMMLRQPFGELEEPGRPPIINPSTAPYVDPFAMDIDLDTVAFWSQAPSAFEVSDWDLYLSAMGLPTQ
ncbi:fungal-specific transcription factor domain-containing protein [Mycena amicta]|nr:fungal-specific transcription factor domain-containing protein [Mycena amicta]